MDINSYIPLVSVITVAYNSVSTIEQTIKSVINQTYKNIEYIIIDGGSTDGTQDIVEKYKNNISQFISGKDNGIYDAMNKGIGLANGEIIGIINSDDWYEADAVENVVNAFAINSEAGIVYGNVFYVEENKKQKLKVPDNLKTLWYQMAIPHSTIFIKNSVYKKFGLFDLEYKIAADYELIVRLYSKGVAFKYLNHVLANFRFGGISQRKILECKAETSKISYKYIMLYSENEDVKCLPNEIKGWIAFGSMLETDPNRVISMLNDYFQANLSKLVIFGAGEWGKRCTKALEKSYIKISYIADNYNEGEFLGKKIVKPSLISYDEYVLVAVQKQEELIEEQLKQAGIVKNVSIEKLIRKYMCF